MGSGLVVAQRGVFRMNRFVVVAAAIVLGGCIPTENQANAFKIGASTYSDVRAVLGAPTANALAPDGKRIVVYTRLPQSSDVKFIFDHNGVLTARSSTQSGAATSPQTTSDSVRQ